MTALGSEQSFAAIRFNVCFNPIPKAETLRQGEGYWTRLLEPIFGVFSTKCALRYCKTSPEVIQVVEAGWDVTDEFRELAMALKGRMPTEVVRQIGAAQMQPEPMTLKKMLEEYREFKAKAGEDNRSLKSRVSRISKDLIQVLGKNRFEWTPLANITRKGSAPEGAGQTPC